MDVVTMEQAKLHLRIAEDVEHFDDDLQMKLDQAHAIVKDYILRGDDDWAAEVEAWDDETVPQQVVAAVLIQLTHLWRFRGDELEGDRPRQQHGFLAPGVVALLHRLRDPVVQ